MGLLNALLRRRFPFKFVYAAEYWMVDLGRHVFPVRKYRLVYEKLLALGVQKDHFLAPEPASEEDLLLVHSPKYLKKLSTGTLSRAELAALELPFAPDLLRFTLLHVGGTQLACRRALEDGVCVHLGGGFHHAFRDHGEGFCVLNDIAVAVETLRRARAIDRAMIVDCDLHQGNGTAAIFEKRPDVFTFSIHQMDIYPAEKSASTVDVGLWSGDGDARYLFAMGEHFPRLFQEFKPDLVVYVAGADPREGDQLGGLRLTDQGLAARDRIVIEGTQRLGIPVAIVLAGGYGRDLADTVGAHLNTIKVAAAVRRRLRSPRRSISGTRRCLRRWERR